MDLGPAFAGAACSSERGFCAEHVSALTCAFSVGDTGLEPMTSAV